MLRAREGTGNEKKIKDGQEKDKLGENQRRSDLSVNRNIVRLAFDGSCPKKSQVARSKNRAAATGRRFYELSGNYYIKRVLANQKERVTIWEIIW